MLDEKIIMERIRNMTSEERVKIMQKALKDSGIMCTDGPGTVIFDGFTPDIETHSWKSRLDVYVSRENKFGQYDSNNMCQQVSTHVSVDLKSGFELEISMLAA